MKPHKIAGMAALCLLSAFGITAGLKLWPASAEPSVSVAQTAPTPHVVNASLSKPALRNAVLDEDGVTVENTPIRAFPQVSEFTLTPPNPAAQLFQTMLTVHFAGGDAERLPARIPMLLGNQHVVVQRSRDDSNEFFTLVNFDWTAFSQEQAKRKQAAEGGKTVPIFHGRELVGRQTMQFLDPSEIQQALESHQTLHLSPQLFIDGPQSVIPDHELMITAIPVVEDHTRTFDPCLPTTNQNHNGAWTFQTLIMAIACSTGPGNCTTLAAENMLLSMLDSWQQPVTINNFTVNGRSGIGSLGTAGFLGNWPIDHTITGSCTDPFTNQPSACPSLANAPVHLNAIVNRIDIGQNSPPFPGGGELRFVFGVTASSTFTGTVTPCSGFGNQLFNIIIEYAVPSSFNAAQWASVWNGLEENGTFDDTYRNQLQTITDKVVTAGACTSSTGAHVSCLDQIRTNEVILQFPQWELRQFQLGLNPSGKPILNPSTVAMTPDGSFNTNGQPQCTSNCNNSGDMGHWINSNLNQILQTGGVLPIVPAVLPNGDHFLGGSALNNGNAFWADAVPLLQERGRVDFSVNTCNGCHGGETFISPQILFQQVVNRSAGVSGGDSPSNLSDFLLGCTDSTDTCNPTNGRQCSLNSPCTEAVVDPNFGGLSTAFGDILRRQTYMQGLLGAGPGSGGMFLPFLAQPVGSH